MATVDDIPKTYAEAVRTLAWWHGEEAEKDLIIFAFPDPRGTVVRLVEVSNVFPETGQAIAFPMGRSQEFPFKSEVVLVTPEEWRQIEAGKLSLPRKWDLTSKRKVWPHEAA